MNTIREFERNLPVLSDWDVIVAGGGFAGISAALAAAREGARVCLLEREWLLGGLGTLGLISIYLPLCDGMGHQVIAGLGEEWLRLSLADALTDGHVPYPTPWLEDGSPEDRVKVRFQAEYNPSAFALRAEKRLLESGVTLRYGALLCGAKTDGDRITHVIFEDKGGRFALSARAFVDATGDADLCLLAGAPTRTYGPGNILAAWHGLCVQDHYRLRTVGAADVPEKLKTGREAPLLESQRYSGLDGDDLNRLVQRSHEVTLARVRDGRALATLPGIPQIRMTRRLDGQAVLHDDPTRQSYPDSIGMTGDWRRRGPVYELPLGILRCDSVSNLFAAGRCVSVTDDMWDITRVIPGCAVTGQAAGTAAAMTAATGGVQIAPLQQTLQKNGVLLHLNEMR